MKLWAREVIEHQELSGLFCRSLEDNNVKSSTDDGGLAYEVSEESKESYQTICQRICGVWSAGAREMAMMNKRPKPLKKNLWLA